MSLNFIGFFFTHFNIFEFMKFTRKTILALLLPLQILIVKLLSNYPSFIERYYSNGLYPVLSKLWRLLLGWIPFSIGDLCYIMLIIFIIRWLYKNFRNIYKKPKSTFASIIAFLSVAYFCFHFFWGMNYYRLPIHESLQLDNEYTTEELIVTTEKILQKANQVHNDITNNDSLKIDVPYSRSEMFNKTMNGYQTLSKSFPELKLTHKSIKKSIISLPLTYMGFGGYLNPFTNESQVNSKIPKYRFPNVSCHEQAHQLGFAAENEANFIGCLAALNNDDKYFQYSGIVFALRSCLRELYRRDQPYYEKLKDQINPGILKNYQESRDFWDAYQNPIEPLFKTSYDSFLKANNQQNGINSYSYVVALLVNYNKKHTTTFQVN